MGFVQQPGQEKLGALAGPRPEVVGVGAGGGGLHRKEMQETVQFSLLLFLD